MPTAVRERIVSGGQGLPLYLDLSVSHFVELLSRGRQPSVGDFDTAATVTDIHHATPGVGRATRR